MPVYFAATYLFKYPNHCRLAKTQLVGNIACRVASGEEIDNIFVLSGRKRFHEGQGSYETTISSPELLNIYL